MKGSPPSLLLLLPLLPFACRAPAPRPRADSPTPGPSAAASPTLRPPTEAAYPIPPFSRHLRGLRICLDPGHGGDAGIPIYKRGPTGVREAEANLRVALALREFLVEAGAVVVMTRSDDRDVPLAERPAVAAREGCDLFLSIHHNAVSDPGVNYGTVWVHAGPDHSPASLDLARSVYREVSRILELPQSAVCPILSDRLLYESGFAVLRAAAMPAALSEASFHTNPEEEKRLADPVYNRREAYGHFLGLARYAEGGLPRARLLSPTVGADAPLVRLALDDGLQERKGWGSERPRILASTIVLRIDGRLVPFEYDGASALVAAEARGLGGGTHSLDLRFENVFKHSNHPVRFEFEVVP